jgi:pimeloyl-ACP methyl ester carboxylesterase
MRTAASDQSDRVASIILIGAGGQILPSAETQALYRRWMDPSTPPEEWTELNSTLMYAPGNEHLAAAAVELGTFPTVARAQVEASNSTPPEDWVSGGSAPMLVIVGLQDRVAIPANGLEIATRRPSTWLLGIPDCGHNMVDEQPETLSHEIAEFINRNSS